MTFSQKFFLMGQHQIGYSRNGPAQIRNSWNGPAHTGNSWKGPAQIGNSGNGLAQFRISRLAHFGNSCFGLAHYRNSWYGLAYFGIFLFGAVSLNKTFEKMLFFFVCFLLPCASFWPLTLLYSDDMHILQKDWFKTFIPAWNRSLLDKWKSKYT